MNFRYTKNRALSMLLTNLAVFVGGAYGIYGHIMSVKHSIFILYTVDSNILLCLACLVLCLYDFKLFKGKIETVPLWAQTFKYFACCTTCITFLIVMFVLMPVWGVELLKGHLFWNHLYAPVLGFVSLLVFDRPIENRKKAAALAVIPTFVYGLVLVPLNIARIVDGPYPFLKVYEQSLAVSVLWAVALFAGAYLLAYVIHALVFKLDKRQRDSYIKKILG